MSGFYNEMIMRMGLPPEEAVGLKITVCEMSGVLIEGHNGLLSYSDEEIVLRVKRKRLVIKGKNLLVLELNKEEAYIKGRLCLLEVEDA